MNRYFVVVMFMLCAILATSCLGNQRTFKEDENDMEEQIVANQDGYEYLRKYMYQKNMFNKNKLESGQRIGGMTASSIKADDAGLIIVFKGDVELTGNAYYAFNGIDRWIIRFYPDVGSLGRLPRMIGDSNNIWIELTSDAAFKLLGPRDLIKSDIGKASRSLSTQNVLKTKATIQISKLTIHDSIWESNKADLVKVIKKQDQEVIEMPPDFELNYSEFVLLLDLPDDYSAIAQTIVSRNDDGTLVLGDYVIFNLCEGIVLNKNAIGKQFQFSGNITRKLPLTVAIPQADLWRGLYE